MEKYAGMERRAVYQEERERKLIRKLVGAETKIYKWLERNFNAENIPGYLHSEWKIVRLFKEEDIIRDKPIRLVEIVYRKNPNLSMLIGWLQYPGVFYFATGFTVQKWKTITSLMNQILEHYLKK